MRVLATLRFFLPNLHDLLEVGGALHDHVRQVFHEHTSLWMVFQLELLLRIFREQISDLFIVDFQVGCTDQELLVLAAIHIPKDVRKSPRNDPMQLFRLGRPDHRVGLASASLPVGKDGTIVTIHDAFHDGIAGVLIKIALYCVLVIDSVEREVLAVLRARSSNTHGSILDHHIHDLFSVVDFLLATQRAASDHDLHAFSLVVRHGGPRRGCDFALS
mmetsp:Transcript_19890/g.46592  ORF Transcript_19890/g.46592 Transcript_19890/m.46592 type:complete len:217 (+) Transcript_19890:1827-2477(+)